MQKDFIICFQQSMLYGGCAMLISEAFSEDSPFCNNSLDEPNEKT